MDDTPHGLDPYDWGALRTLGHRMLDDMIDHLAGLREGPVWRPLPDAERRELRAGGLPRAGIGAERAYEDFQRLVLPYATGNPHPGFCGWVHGGGNPVGMLAELLAGGLNANLGGRDHAPIEVERQVVRWSAEMLGLPQAASGLLVTGTSVANLIGVLLARTTALGRGVRETGLSGRPLVAYASSAAHGCVPRALDMAGLGVGALRPIPANPAGRMRVGPLAARIAEDRAAGLEPFLVVGTAGSVDIGAIDPLADLAALCRTESLWFHVDGAFGALAALSPRLRPLLAGLELADSVAFDFHKWGQAPYDAGCLLARDGARLAETFGQDLAYLRPAVRGLAGNPPWPCDLGPDLSRGFRALKVWMAFKAYGADRIGRAIEACCEVARHLAARVEAEPFLELLAPVGLNIVCFRVRDDRLDPDTLDRLNAELVADVQEAGLAAPSTTRIGGRLAIRAAFVNHRTRTNDADRLVEAVLAAARTRESRG